MKLQKKFKFLFLTFAIIITFLSIFTAPMVTPFLLGGVILQGILGGFSGKVGPVVGGKWKDIDYMRGYVVPENPNTAGQQTVRTKFSALVSLARELLSAILQPYWDPFQSSMSGFNKWISENYSLVDGSNLLTVNNLMSKGTLDPASILDLDYDSGTGVVSVTFDSAIQGDGLGTDEVICIGMIQGDNPVIINTSTGQTRSDGSCNITFATGLLAGTMLVWIFFVQGTGSEMKVSDSTSFSEAI